MVDRPFPLIETLMSRKAIEVSEISQVYFSAGVDRSYKMIKFFSAG